MTRQVSSNMNISFTLRYPEITSKSTSRTLIYVHETIMRYWQHRMSDPTKGNSSPNHLSWKFFVLIPNAAAVGSTLTYEIGPGRCWIGSYLRVP